MTTSTPVRKDGAWRQMLLKRAGFLQSQIARALEVPESTVSRVIAGRYPWTAGEAGSRRARIEAHFAKLVGLAVDEAFPTEGETEHPRR